MGSFFDYDGPFFSILGKLVDLIILNILTLIFCIPIVTIGASLTACHYTALKIRRDEGHVIKNFWKSFKDNFVQSTIIWLILAVYGVVSLFASTHAMFGIDGMASTITNGIVFIVLFLTSLIGLWLFPLQSKFVNNISGTFKNALFMAFNHLFRSVAMLIVNLLPLLLVLFLDFQWYSVLFSFGVSAPIYLCTMIYDKTFEKIEHMITEEQDAVE